MSLAESKDDEGIKRDKGSVMKHHIWQMIRKKKSSRKCDHAGDCKVLRNLRGWREAKVDPPEGDPC